MSVDQTVSTLSLPPTTSCPRCDGPGGIALAVNAGSQFAWHEYRDCDSLWATPRGWTPHAEPRLRPSTN
jgi:hypothetical protein